MTSNEETEGYDINSDIKFIVTLPNKPISHNATTVSEDGKTLTWDLADKDTQNIQFEFSLINPLLIYGIIGGAVLLLIIIIILIVVKIKKKKNNQNTEETYEPENVNNFAQNPFNNNYQAPNVNFGQPMQNQAPEIIGEEFNDIPETSSFINVTNEQISNIYNEPVQNITNEIPNLYDQPIQNQSVINEVPNAYSEPTQNIINETSASPISDIKTQVNTPNENTYNPFNNNNLN